MSVPTRRHVIALLGSAAFVCPGAVLAQEASRPAIGFLHSGARDQNLPRLAAFLRGLDKAGFVDGQNVTIEYRWAAGNIEHLPTLAADLIRRGVSLIATPGSTPAGLVAKAATDRIPIVFTTGADPVATGFVTSLNRPGANITGVTSLNAGVAAKRLGALHELLPKAVRYCGLINPTSILSVPFREEFEAGAAKLRVASAILPAKDLPELETTLAGLRPGEVVAFSSDAYFYMHRAEVTALCAKYRVPAAFDDREYVEAGGLMSYGADWLPLMEIAGTYVGRILKGEKPAELPVTQAAKFELVVNLGAARTLGITVPPYLLAAADEVVE